MRYICLAIEMQAIWATLVIPQLLADPYLPVTPKFDVAQWYHAYKTNEEDDYQERGMLPENWTELVVFEPEPEPWTW